MTSIASHPARPRAAAPATALAAAETADWLRHWCATPGMLARLDQLNVLLKRRLASYEAAEVWLKLLRKAGGIATQAQMESLLRQFLVLAPEHAQAGALYDLLMNEPSAGTTPPGMVFMITSCMRYLPQAERVLADLRARGAEAVIVIGDPSTEVAVEHGPIVSLPVEDSYEALLSKVLEGLSYLRRRHGPQVAIAKVDDDMQFSDRFAPAALARLARQNDYVGQPHGLTGCDRCWHVGKTSQPTPIYTRRRQGHFAYGPLYLLGPRAVEHLVREWLFYPGEFAGCIAEDRAVGDTLRRAGITPLPTSFADMGGVCDNAERLIPAGS